jgi:hypothetical protein
MTDENGYGGPALVRLLALRWPQVASSADALRPDVEAVLAGGVAEPSLLRRLAPVLGWHAADLFVVAGIDLPEDLVPATGTGPWDVGNLLNDAARLSPASLDRLHELVRSLPARPPAWPPVPPMRSNPLGPGETLLRLLRNRNIRPYSAKTLYLLGDGPVVSYSTVGMLGPGRTRLTPHFLSAFASVLNIPAHELSAIVGVAPATGLRPHRHRVKLAQLAWDARRLTERQLDEVLNLARQLLKLY